jgi:hypothetical protein
MDLHRLLRPERPWLHVLVANESEACDLRTALPETPPGRVAFRVVRGHKARTTAALFDEFAAALQFPCYFGENWDAFDECIADLGWLLGDTYLILIVQSLHLLEGEPPEQFQQLLKVLENAGEEWSRPATGPSPRPARAFHVLLQCSREEEGALRERLRSAKVSAGHLHL